MGIFLGVCFNFRYNLSLRLIDRMIPAVIHVDFLCYTCYNEQFSLGNEYCAVE